MPESLLEVRCSPLPRIAICNASSKHPQLAAFDSNSEEARLGVAVHEILAQVAKEDLSVVPDVVEICDRHGISDYEDVTRLSWAGVNFLNKAKTWLNILMVEKKLDSIIGGTYHLSGTADVIGDHEETLIIIDWKSGRIQNDTREQLSGYAKLSMDNLAKMTEGKADLESYKEVKIITVWLRTRETETHTFTSKYIESEWTTKFIHWMESDKYTPTPDACRYCPIQYECDARQQMVRSLTASLSEKGLEEFTEQDLADRWEPVKILKSIITNYEETVKNMIKERGHIEDSQGRKISFVTSDVEKIDLQAPGGIIDRFFIDRKFASYDLTPALSISKTKLLKIVREFAPRGEKKELADEFMELMRAGNAVSVSQRNTVVITNQKEIKDGE